MKTLISISYCAEHYKGGDRINRMNGQRHAEWLAAAVALYDDIAPVEVYLNYDDDFDIIVSCTGFPGILNVEQTPDSCERDVMWDVINGVKCIVSVPDNPGHQVGAALCIRMGLEAAHKWGYECLIHTAEDVVPRRGALAGMVRAIKEGVSYAGEMWGVEQDELNSQFFACRVNDLVGPWDACAVPGHGHIERYLRDLLADRQKYLKRDQYRTCHDFAQFRQWVQEEQAASAGLTKP